MFSSFFLFSLYLTDGFWRYVFSSWPHPPPHHQSQLKTCSFSVGSRPRVWPLVHGQAAARVCSPDPSTATSLHEGLPAHWRCIQPVAAATDLGAPMGREVTYGGRLPWHGGQAAKSGGPVRPTQETLYSRCTTESLEHKDLSLVAVLPPVSALPAAPCAAPGGPLQAHRLGGPVPCN